MKAKNQYIKNCLLASFAFGTPFFIMYVLATGKILISFILCGGGGFFFGISMTLFIFYQTKKMNKVRYEIEKQHSIIFDGAANHWEGSISSGGWIFLTEGFLYFTPHRFNRNLIEVKIPYGEISQVSKFWKIKSIKIVCVDGRIESFVVNERKRWISILNQQIKDCKCQKETVYG